jgi:hypothetical protein
VNADDPLVSQAIVSWTGFGAASWPSPDDARLVERFDREQAMDLIPIVRKLYDEFYQSDARYVASDLAEMGRLASRRFSELHPEIAHDAVRALAWCYTFDHK